MEVVQLLGFQGLWQHQVLSGVGNSGSKKYASLERYGNKYWPVCSDMFAWRTPLPDREAWQATVYRVAKSRTRLSGSLSLFTFCMWVVHWDLLPRLL